MRERRLQEEDQFTLRLFQRRSHSKQHEYFFMKLTSCFFLSNLSLLIKDILLEINQNNMNDSNQQQSTDKNTNGHEQSLYGGLQEHQEKQLEYFTSRI